MHELFGTGTLQQPDQRRQFGCNRKFAQSFLCEGVFMERRYNFPTGIQQRERERRTMMCAWAGWYEQASWGEGGAREKGAGGLVAGWPEGEGARE